MIKHIILWQLKDELSADEKAKAVAGAKAALESLAGKIDGLLSINVITDGLSSSNADMMLDSTFADEKSLHCYSANALHVAAANGFVRPFIKSRSCFDFEI